MRKIRRGSGPQRGAVASITTGWALLSTLLLAGCSLDGLLKSNELPPDVSDPALIQTPQGAVAAYHSALAQFGAAFGGSGAFVPTTGLLGDELLDARSLLDFGGNFAASRVDLRLMPEDQSSGAENTYAALHQVRALAGQAIGLLSRYVPEQPTLQAHTYALEGYAEVFLAELFCSGIPLSTVDFTGDYTYQPGSSTGDVFAHARALFDTALTLAGDSARLVQLASVGKARVLLALGDYTGAAAAVAGVSDAYVYQVSYDADTALHANNFVMFSHGDPGWTVANQEGVNGIDYRTSGDPRSTMTQHGSYTVGASSYPIYAPNKYDPAGTSPIVLASGVEARLIEAEAALQAGDVGTWLDKLNHLRETAIVPALSDTTDPGTLDGRVDLLFRERALWLFLTGHRQGDLRRLIRQYGRTAGHVYPTGTYPNGTLGEQYGGDVTAPIPTTERQLNPKFTGCISRNA